VINKEDRNEETLKNIVKKYIMFLKDEDFIAEQYPQIPKFLPEDIFFITTRSWRTCIRAFSEGERGCNCKGEKSDISHENRRCSQIREET